MAPNTHIPKMIFAAAAVVLLLLLVGNGLTTRGMTRTVTFIDSGQALDPGDSRKTLLGDFDNDGDLDAVFINPFPWPDTLWHNDGSGTFSKVQDLLAHPGGFEEGGAVGDVNGDGFLDLVGVGGSNNYLALNAGNGSLGAPVNILTDTEERINDVALADFDGDGDLDLFVGRAAANWVYRNDGSGGFSDTGQALGTGWTNRVIAEDFDGDGDLDVATANGISSVATSKIWRNDGSGNFVDGGDTSDRWAYGVVSADFNNDDAPDLAFATWAGPSKVYLNSGNGTFTDSGQQLGSGQLDIASADLDRDGDSDLLLTNGIVSLYRNDGSGTFTNQNTGGSLPAEDDLIQSIALGDVDDDGDADAVLGAVNFNPLWLNTSGVPQPTPLPTRIANPLVDRVSIASDGGDPNGWSGNPAISADGTWIVFDSTASNLVPNDTNGDSDIFVHNRQTGSTERISVSGDGTEANSYSYRPDISADGRYIVFESSADNLVSGDVNGTRDIFLHDRQTGTTRLVSMHTNGTLGNGASSGAFISADGSTVVYSSDATNLVIIDQNDMGDVFFYDVALGTTTMASVRSDGLQADGPSRAADVSADGNLIAFVSIATNLVPSESDRTADVYVRDRRGFVTRAVSVADGGTAVEADARAASISNSGDVVAFEANFDALVPEDQNRLADIFTHVIASGDTERRSTTATGRALTGSSAEPALAGGGLHVAFTTWADNADGLPVAWEDVFLKEIAAGTVLRVSVNMAGEPSYARSGAPAVSADGRFVAFESGSPLVLADGNKRRDVYVFDRLGSAEPVTFPPWPTPRPTPNRTDYPDDSAPCLTGVCAMLAWIFAQDCTRMADALGDANSAEFRLANIYYDTRDLLEQSVTGQAIIDDYYTHSPEVVQLMRSNPAIMADAGRVILGFAPVLQSVTRGDGDATVTPANVAGLESLLDQLAQAGSPALQTMLQRQRDTVGDLDQFIGLTAAEAASTALGHAVYLPFVTSE